MRDWSNLSGLPSAQVTVSPDIKRRWSLDRLFRPSSIAIVGASDGQLRSVNASSAIRKAGIELHLVNPNKVQVHGQPTVPSLEAIGKPVDAVLSLVGPAVTVEVVEQAAALGAGGVVAIAGGFGEGGGEGSDLAARLAVLGQDIPVIGPNCNGLINVRSGARLSGAPHLPLKAGHIACVTHSGGFMGAFGIAGCERGVGFSYLASTGNETVVDIADCLDFLVRDEETCAIGLIIESVRRPDAFFAAVRRAHQVGKPIVALKLGKSVRAQELALSHTGAIAGEYRVYQSAFRQHGIMMAEDFVDLIDRLAVFEHLEPRRWCRVDGLAIASLSGGWASLATDIAVEEGVAIPALQREGTAIRALVPSAEVVNPLDLTGIAMSRPDMVLGALEVLMASPDVDALVLQWFLDEASESHGQALIAPAKELAARFGKPIFIGSVEDGRVGSWASELPRSGLVPGRGPRATLRAIRSMSEFAAFRDRPRTSRPAIIRPFGEERRCVVQSEVGPMLDFESAMHLLDSAGIPRAPFVVVAKDGMAPTVLPFGFPCVVKLADVAHRTELGAVRINVGKSQLAAAIAEMRRIAQSHGASQKVAIQPMLRFHSEAFVGIKSDSELGPMVMAGVGGIFVELLQAVAGRIAPLDEGDAEDVLDELAASRVTTGFRGAPPWDRASLSAILLNASDLAVSSKAWLRSLDINPLCFGGDGFVAVDALCLVRENKLPTS